MANVLPTQIAQRDQPSRRDFIYVATAAVGAIGGAIAAWPLIAQMNPDATATAESSIDVDLSDIEIGQSITVKWRGRPVFIRRRTASEIAAAVSTALPALIDQVARNPMIDANAPATDDGVPPNLISPPAGCAFFPRCRRATPECAQQPPLTVFGDRQVCCWCAPKKP